MMTKNKEKNKVLVWPWAVGAAGFVIIIWVLSGVLIYKYIPATTSSSSPWTERGTFGDMFGAVNALFSGLAFAGVIIAIFLQRKELEFQREELELTRGEFEKQTEEFEKQNDNLNIQRFENTFFNMLDLLNEIVRNITSIDGNGQKAFRVFRKDWKPKRGPGDANPYERYSRFNEVSKREKVTVMRILINKQHLEQYFRVIYTTLKFIEESKLIYKDKKRYSNILRSQLSNDELFFLGYNCIIEKGFIPFKMLLEKYTFLKHLPQNEKDYLIQQEEGDNIIFYHSRTFDKNIKFSREYLEEMDNQFKKLGIDNFINYEEIHDLDLEWLSNKAYIAYDESGKYLDKYSGSVTGGRPARHILYDFCSDFWEKSIKHLGGGGPYICYHQLNKFLEIDKHPDILRKYGRSLSAYKILCSTIPESDRQAVFDEIFSISKDYMKSYSEISHILEMKSEKLDTMIENNDDLSESKSVKKLISENMRYKEWLKLGLDDVKDFVENPKEKPDGWQFRETLYMLLILYIVSKYDKWGYVEESA